MSAPSPSPTRPPGTIKIGTIAGSDVLVSSSWFLVAAMIAVLISPRVDQVQPGLGPGKYLAGLAFAVILYGSVLLHEASHALMARHYGLPVGAITLHFLGGMTAIEAESKRPREEFAVAVVGPITSLAVGLASLGLLLVAPAGLIQLALEGLAGANLLVGVLNLIPGLPLDGGRVLKSAVWGATGSPHRGTLIAGWGGRVTAIAALGWPWLQAAIFGVPVEFLDHVIAIVVAMFLWGGASAAISSGRIRIRLAGVTAHQLARRTIAVPGDLPLSEAVRRAHEDRCGSIITVTASGEPVGIVNEAALVAVPDDRRPWVATATVARQIDASLRLPATLTGDALVRAVTAHPSGEYLLVDSDGGIYGVLATADLERALRSNPSS